MKPRIGRLETIVIDVSDVDRSNVFWATVLGFEPGTPTRGWVKVGDVAPGVRLILQQVPEEKIAKNRVHLDLFLTDLDEGIRQIEALGGSRLEERDDGLGRFFVMADPDGNEFCVGPEPSE